jgi:hypothetical protein
MQHPPPISAAPSQPTTKFVLTRKELDRPLGIGNDIIEVETPLEWVGETDTEVLQPSGGGE